MAHTFYAALRHAEIDPVLPLPGEPKRAARDEFAPDGKTLALMLENIVAEAR